MPGSFAQQVVRRAGNATARIASRRSFRSSTDYWNQRYAEGGNSGIGSYGQLADFKADVLNKFVAERAIQSVLEFGCGDGNQLGLASYPSYIGLDVAKGAIDACARRFGNDTTKSFFLYDQDRFIDHASLFCVDATLSLDVIFHLVEDAVFERYMNLLFGCANRFVVIYSSNETARDSAAHVRHRPFTTWVEQNVTDWTLLDKVRNPHRGEAGAVADFYMFARAAT